MKTMRKVNQKGMTLVEVMVALTVFTLTITTIIAIMTTLAHVKWQVMMNDQETDAQRSNIEEQIDKQSASSISDFNVGTTDTNKVKFTLGGGLSDLIPDTNPMYVYYYESDGISFADQVDWRLKFFTTKSKSLLGDFTPDPTTKLYKVNIHNYSDNNIQLIVDYTAAEGEVRYYTTQTAYTLVKDNLYIPARGSIAIGVKVLDDSKFMKLTVGTSTPLLLNYSLFSTAGEYELYYDASSLTFTNPDDTTP